MDVRNMGLYFLKISHYISGQENSLKQLEIVKHHLGLLLKNPLKFMNYHCDNLNLISTIEKIEKIFLTLGWKGVNFQMIF